MGVCSDVVCTGIWCAPECGVLQCGVLQCGVHRNMVCTGIWCAPECGVHQNVVSSNVVCTRMWCAAVLQDGASRCTNMCTSGQTMTGRGGVRGCEYNRLIYSPAFSSPL